ncbi:hypothetical protein CAL7716_103620 (plasmid) [Calothrix sp. PCC 7716]|nr:hypothetical protein CAL7716_103620 [Calothrix sp. PCC 7716]
MASGIDKLSNLVTQTAELAKEGLTEKPGEQESKSDEIVTLHIDNQQFSF